MKSRSKSDWAIKALALFQISWFGIQLLIRRIQHLHITAIEILTLAFIVCSSVTYILCWSQPQNIEYEVPLGKGTTGEDATREDAIKEKTSGEHTAEEETTTEEATAEHAAAEETTREHATGEHASGGGAAGKDATGKDLSVEMANRDEGEPNTTANPAQNPRVGESSARGNDDLEKCEPQIQSRSVPARSRIQEICRSELDRIDIQERIQEIRRYELHKDLKRMNRVTSFLFASMGAAFGAAHCLAWTSTYPTPKERLAWRVCCVVTTSLPPIGILVISLLNRSTKHMKKSSESDSPKFNRHVVVVMIEELSFLLLLAFYITARVTLVVLALMALRALPADVFQTTGWNNVIPHVGV